MSPELLLQQVLYFPEEKTLSLRLLSMDPKDRNLYSLSWPEISIQMPPTPRKSSQAAVQEIVSLTSSMLLA